jgi:hypothetical protein
MLVAGFPKSAQETGLCLILRYNGEDQTFHRWVQCDHEYSHKIVKWLPGERLAVVSDNLQQAKIHVFSPFKDGVEPQILEMEEKCRWVKCRGDLLILQALDSTKVRVFEDPYVEKPFSTHDTNSFLECDMQFHIKECAFSHGILVCLEDGSTEICIWDTEKEGRPRKVDTETVMKRVQALDVKDKTQPIFVLIAEDSVSFVDKYGHFSKPENIWEDAKVKAFSRTGDFAIGASDSDVKSVRFCRLYD